LTTFYPDYTKRPAFTAEVVFPQYCFGLSMTLKVVLALTLWVAGTALSHDNHESHDDHACGHDHYHCGGNHTEDSGLRRILDVFHLAVDGKEHHHIHSVSDFFRIYGRPSSWKAIGESYNFKEIGIRVGRAYRMFRNQPELWDHSKNLLLIFPLSHAIEVLAAPAFVTVAAGELPGEIVASGGAILSIIAIPGLDPLCILLMASYPLPAVHQSVNALRKTIEWSLTHLATMSGLSWAYQSWTEEIDPLAELSKMMLLSSPDEQLPTAANPQRLSIKDNGTITSMTLLNPSGKEVIMELAFERNQGDTYLYQIGFLEPTENAQQLKEGLQALQPLVPGDLRPGLEELLTALGQGDWSELKHQFYIAEVDNFDPSILRITYQPGALAWPKVRQMANNQSLRRNLATRLQDCQARLLRR
jgi:hypothetical protein